jgi:hypothetical protein
MIDLSLRSGESDVHTVLRYNFPVPNEQQHITTWDKNRLVSRTPMLDIPGRNLVREFKFCNNWLHSSCSLETYPLLDSFQIP